MAQSSALDSAREFANLVKLNYKSSRVFLFGSQVKGTANIDSDIDIAVVLDDYPNKLDVTLELMRLRRKIDSRIEPHPFRKIEFDVTNKLVEEIYKYGFEILN